MRVECIDLCQRGIRNIWWRWNFSCGCSYSIHTFVKTCQIVHFKCVQFIVHKLYLIKIVFKNGMKEMKLKWCHYFITLRNIILYHWCAVHVREILEAQAKLKTSASVLLILKGPLWLVKQCFDSGFVQLIVWHHPEHRG